MAVRRKYLLFLLMVTLPVVGSYAQQPVPEVIRSSFNSSEKFDFIPAIEGEKLHHPADLEHLYEIVEYSPLWIDKVNRNTFLSLVGESRLEGLLPEDYHYGKLRELMAVQARTEVQNGHADILLTDAFLTYGTHLWRGKANPELLHSGKWERTAADIDLNMLLLDALGNRSIAKTLEKLRPHLREYHEFRKVMDSLEEDHTMPILVPDGADLEVGMEDERINLVRLRLGLSDTLNSCYDSILELDILDFQRQHGLAADGVIGKRTRAALNESREETIDRIKVNLERMRWLPRAMPAEYVVINIPDFRLRVVKGDSVVLAMRTIVGRPDRSTPVFNSVIRYLILNPTWVVPPTVLKEDVLPKVKRNISYLAKNNLRVIDKHGTEIDPTSLSWEKYTYRNFPYQLLQDPGLFNSMGLIKFQFPNQYKVFLHDTNSRALFSQTYRALSSGCIRVERPLELASHLLPGTRWSVEKLGKEIATGKTRTILFDKPTPIYLEYFTAFIDEEGLIGVRQDVYGYDPIVLKAIQAPMK